jgi:hypothetical protein
MEANTVMEPTVQDRLDIADLMTGWMYRDIGAWDALQTLFHPDGTIAVTWFEGSATDFVEGSRRMSQSNTRSKHLIGSPVIEFNGNKAIAETNAVIIGDGPALDLGCVTHSRLYDRVEKRNGAWKIVQRQIVYDMAYFTFPAGPTEIDREVLARHPREYAALAYMLEKNGFPVSRVFATKGSDLEHEMKSVARAWLKA